MKKRAFIRAKPVRSFALLFLALLLFYPASLLATPVEKGFARIDGGRLYYEATGHGPALILIHAHSVDRRMWDAQFFALATQYRVIRYDLRGYGRSSQPREGRDFSHAADLHRLLQDLHLEKAHLVGLSLGSWVALDFLAAHPEKCLSLTVASGGLHDPANWKTETPAQRTLRLEKNHADKLQSIQQVQRQGLSAYKKQWLELLLQWCGPQREKIRPALQTMIHDWSAWQPLHLEPGEGTSTFAATSSPTTTTQILSGRKLRTPVLILIGQNDVQGSQDASAHLHRILPAARVVRLPGAGHFSALETPTAFNTALLHFLARTPP